jgi:Ser/Thr protein kinase RdoA (MazF antagonist)
MTPFADVTSVAAQFVLKGRVGSARAFGGGHINETFLVETAADDYVVQRINTAVFADPNQLVENVAAVTAHLGGRFLPEPVPARSGGWLVHDGYGVWRAWIRVARAESRSVSDPVRAASAAKLLAEFHVGLADLAPDALHEPLPNFHDPGRRLARLRDIVAADPFGRVAGVESEISVAFAAAPLAAMAEELVAAVPRRIAHNDPKLDNFLFRDGEAMCLVDLDTVMPSAWFWDVGDLLRTASTYAVEDDPQTERVVADPGLYRAVLDGYRGVMSTSMDVDDAEADALESAGAIVTFEQAVRFLTDWIEGDVYFRTSRPRHNLDRARAQLHLLASMPGTVSTL